MMTADYKITFGFPEEDFWEQFGLLWTHSEEPCPFKSPQILRYFASETKEELITFRYYADQELKGAVILKKHKSNLTFLSDLKTDVNFFILHQENTQEESKAFFRYILEKAEQEHWSLTLNNQPAWARYMSPFTEAARESSMFMQDLPYSVCPRIEAESPQALFAHINGLREFRYRVNRLKNHHDAVFEALTDEAGIDEWADEFCDAHIRRWADTATPSSFRDSARIQFLKGCLHAWQKDGILVRFSIRTGDRRVGFVVGLRQKETMIHHSTTYDPDFRKSSPGIAIIHFMGEWMQQQQMRILDFGDGNEAYKYTVANAEHQLHRIFISHKWDLPFIGKTRLIQFVKNHPKAYALYQNRFKPFLGAS